MHVAGALTSRSACEARSWLDRQETLCYTHLFMGKPLRPHGRQGRRAVSVWVGAGILAVLLGASGVVVVAWLGDRATGKALAKRLNLPRPAVIAHRGASYLAPEATRPAYLLARELGVDYLEADIQRSRDGVLIAFHDDTLERTTDVARVYPGRASARIDAFTWSELQQLDAGSWFNDRYPARARPSFARTPIISLDDLLDMAQPTADRIGLYLETKAAGQYPGIESQLVEQLTRRGWISSDGKEDTRRRSRLIFQSFEAESLVRLRQLAPQIPRVLLLDEVLLSQEGWESVLKKASDIAVGIGTWGARHTWGPGWSVRLVPDRYMTIWPWYTRSAHRAGLVVHAWTIDEPWELRLVSWFGADGVFTNRPEVAQAVYGLRLRPALDVLWERIGY